MAAIAYQTTVSRLRHYPVKGLKGLDCEKARLEPGRGMPFDREFALLLPPLPDLTVTDRGRLPYMYLARNPELSRFRLDWKGSSFCLIAPNGESATLDFAKGESATEINRVLARWFAHLPQSSPVLASSRPDGGYWDFSDTAISIINLATVRDIAETTGRTIDPLRFRANLYVDGLPPWREFDLIGRTVSAGEAKLDILRGIARCNATSIDPSTDEIDMNMPAHLRKTYGHVYCGVYARVVEAGDIGTGDAMAITGDFGENPYAIRAATSRPPQEWPRFAVVESRNESTVVLRSKLESWPLLDVWNEAFLYIHPTTLGCGTVEKVPLRDTSTRSSYEIEISDNRVRKGMEILISGPYARPPAASQ